MAYRQKCGECEGRVSETGDNCWYCDGRGYLVCPEDDMEAAMDDDDLDAEIDQ